MVGGAGRDTLVFDAADQVMDGGASRNVLKVMVANVNLTKTASTQLINIQSINLRKNRIRNVVAFEVNNPISMFSKDGRTRGFITVDVKGAPDPTDARRINVKFEACRVTLSDSPIDIKIPLGAVGPTGWLRTAFVDDDFRITRGHTGSVFIPFSYTHLTLPPNNKVWR